MSAPPSRQSWIWHLAGEIAEHCRAHGSHVDDIELAVRPIDGALRVTACDMQLGTRRRPCIVTTGTLPSGGDPQTVGQEIAQALRKELARLSRPDPVVEGVALTTAVRQMAVSVRAHVRPERFRA